MVHVHQCFQAVGHGTFFTGVIATARDEPIFSWVYDCGSKRPTRLNAEILNIEHWECWPDEIDLFVLSHFDDDHVNGVERFLSSRRVRHLALPYMDAAQRLAAACATDGGACSASTALFQLDTLAWLRSRGLSDRVDAILRVRGGRRGPDDPTTDAPASPLPFTRDENDIRRERAPQQDDAVQGDYFQGVQVMPGDPQVLTWHHTTPTSRYHVPIEFMFFNTKQNDLFKKDASGHLIAKRSGASIGLVQAEVSAVMHRYRLTDLSKAPRRSWREALRKVYDRHFGHASQARNNISLCLLVRPRAANVGSCSIFYSGSFTRPSANWAPDLNKAGVLLLGDLRIDSAVINEMQDHFGAFRWNAISGVQVPHHGSLHSWTAGNAAAFAPQWFVHCVPDSSAHHPHELVEQDLAGFEVLRADYQTRVAFDYHTVA